MRLNSWQRSPQAVCEPRIRPSHARSHASLADHDQRILRPQQAVRKRAKSGPTARARVLEMCSECIDDFRLLTEPCSAGAAGCRRQRRAVPREIPSQAWSDIGTALPAGHCDRRLQAPVEPHRRRSRSMRCSRRRRRGGLAAPSPRRRGERLRRPRCTPRSASTSSPDRSSRRARSSTPSTSTAPTSC